MSVLELKQVKKSFGDHPVIRDISLSVDQGDVVAVLGPSGSGKTTLLRCAGYLSQADGGTVTLDGETFDLHRISRKDVVHYRRKIGFVFQTYNLIPRMSAQKNVEVPMMYAGVAPAERAERAKQLLIQVGMGERLDHTPDQLSGGQKQRVAIARAMANDPSIILADEPTGALDSKTGRLVMDIFHDLHSMGKTIIFITHSNELAEECERILTLVDGMIVAERRGSEYDQFT